MTDAALLMRDDQGWLFISGTDPEIQQRFPIGSDPSEIAQQLADQMAVSSKRIVLTVDSGDVFFATFELPDSIDAKDRAAITFELERYLPLDAEAVVSDYWSSSATDSSGVQVSAVAVEVARFKAIIEACEHAEIEVVSILPVSFLIAWAITRRHRESSTFRLWVTGKGAFESLWIRQEQIIQWQQFTCQEDLLRHATLVNQTLDEAHPVIVVGTDSRGLESTAEEMNMPVNVCDFDGLQLAVEQATDLIAGKSNHLPNLCRGPLAPADPLAAISGSLRTLALASMACFVLVAGAAWYRGEQLADRSESVRSQMRLEFKRAYPNRRTPIALMRTVRNEHRKTLGSRGRGDAIDLPVVATDVLGRVYQGLQNVQSENETRFRLISSSIIDGTCALTVRAANASQIGNIAKALQSVGFDVQPPASQQIEPSKDEPLPTYQSTIEAVWNGDDS